LSSVWNCLFLSFLVKTVRKKACFSASPACFTGDEQKVAFLTESSRIVKNVKNVQDPRGFIGFEAVRDCYFRSFLTVLSRNDRYSQPECAYKPVGNGTFCTFRTFLIFPHVSHLSVRNLLLPPGFFWEAGINKTVKNCLKLTEIAGIINIIHCSERHPGSPLRGVSPKECR